MRHATGSLDTPMTILVCGEALFDLFQSDGDATGEITFAAKMGGSPFNVAIGISRLGGTAALLTGISHDTLGERLVEKLREETVDTSFLIHNGRRTTLSVVGLDAAGHPSYAFYGAGSADCSLTVDDLPELGPEIAALHFGSYSIAVPPVADAFAELATRYAGRFISLDPNIRPTVEADMTVWRQRIDRLRANVNMIKVSAEDLSTLFPGASPLDIAGQWVSDGAELVVVTDGGNPAHVVRSDEVFQVAPLPVAVVDTVGAGDAFQACLLAGLQSRGTMAVNRRALPRDDLRDLIERASRAAGVACSRQGADLARTGEV